MMRQLDEAERKLAEKGLKKRESDLVEQTKELEYFEEFNAFNEKFKLYLADKEKKQRERKEQLMIQTLKGLKADIELTKETIETLKKQLNEGVEIKSPVGVN